MAQVISYKKLHPSQFKGTNNERDNLYNNNLKGDTFSNIESIRVKFFAVYIGINTDLAQDKLEIFQAQEDLITILEALEVKTKSEIETELVMGIKTLLDIIFITL